MATPNYDINYNDKRFTEVESDKNNALSELDSTYDSMINDTDKYYQAQIDASKEWAETQSQLQQERTDFAIDEIEGQKAQAKKDYTKEQSGAYVDYTKQSAEHGVNAEQMAAMGMQNSGYSESAKVSMYNTYQNRVAAARESYHLAVQSYNNAITEARLQNNSALAEIAYEALGQQLELSLQGFQYKNQLIMEKASKKTELEDTYYQRYLDVLSQINAEKETAETEEEDEDDGIIAPVLGGAIERDEEGGGATEEKSGGISTDNAKIETYIENNTAKNEDGSAKISSVTVPSSIRGYALDAESIAALGRGNLSAPQLNNLVKAGIVEEYIEDGKLKFRYVKKSGMTGGAGGVFYQKHKGEHF